MDRRREREEREKVFLEHQKFGVVWLLKSLLQKLIPMENCSRQLLRWRRPGG